jgi:DNA-binding CsgD family transcriptional regulator
MTSVLVDRAVEAEAVAAVLAAAREGLSGVLVLRGEAGIGKTALLDHAVEAAGDMWVAQVTGVESEMDLGFAGLHLLLVPFLAGVERLPGPQRAALEAALGLAAGPAPDRFLVGLAALTLLTDAAVDRPVLCVVDDAQWLDTVSVEVLGFVARRLLADRVAMLFAVREHEGRAVVLDGLSEVWLGGLPEEAAGELLAVSAGGPVDQHVGERVVAGAAGNPLALVEFAGELTAEELSGAVPVAEPLRFRGRLEELYRARVRALPGQAQMLLLLAAAEPTGDVAVLWRAAGWAGIDREAAELPAVERLVALAPKVRFRHPLMRSAAYYAAPAVARRRAHEALAAASDPEVDPDRRAWHLAEAAGGPDEHVAAELERSAGRAQARGGLAAAAAFLERAVLLTADPARHAERVLAAVRASLQAGAFAKALDLLARAEAGPLDELQSARADLLRGQIAFASGPSADAPALLLKAARRLEPVNLDLARQTYLNAWAAVPLAGRLTGADDLLEVSRAVRALPPVRSPRPADLLLDGLALLVTDGPAAAAPVLRQVVTAFASGDITREEGLASGWLAAGVLWDDEAWCAIMDREVRLAREAGALDELPVNLIPLAMAATWSGDFAAAASLIAEGDTVCEVTGSRIAPYAAMFLAAMRGSQAELTSLVEAAVAAAEAGKQGAAVTCAHWVAAILNNGLGRYADAFTAAGQARADHHLYMSVWALPELIEAAVRTSNTEVATGALERLTESTSVCGTDWALGVEARSRALLSEGEAADRLYREAIERLGRTRIRAELARSQLLYGEWLRRQRRRRDAREQLNAAWQTFDRLGMEAFAERARAELRATGEHARKRTVDTQDVLTPQEAQIARLAGAGATNQEIAARLFISASTVEYHLRKVYRKLGVTSRVRLANLLSKRDPAPSLGD